MKRFKLEDLPKHMQDQAMAILKYYDQPGSQMPAALIPPVKPVEILPDIPFDDMPEKQIQKMAEGYLRQHGIWFLHLSPMAREKIGCPDLLFSINGRACAVELKTVTGKVTPEQARTHTEMEANGWTVRVIRSIQDFVQFVKEQEAA